MDFNTFLITLGLDPSDFVNRYNEPIKTDDGFIYEVEQNIKERKCPHCKGSNVIKHNHKYIEIDFSSNQHAKGILRIKKIRLKCKDCNKTYTPDISGIERNYTISNQKINKIIKDFTNMLSFTQIAATYNLTTARVIQLFDKYINYVPRKKMPFALCIDEKKFAEEINQKYCCFLYDFDSGDIVDVIKNRQLPYLDEYFSNIKEDERNNVKYFISDMNDPYRTVKKKYFPKALHIVDLFHVVKLLTTAVKSIRARFMKSFPNDTKEYRFMKRHWKQFLKRKEEIPDKYFTFKDVEYSYSDMLFNCVIKDKTLNEAYNILQDLYHYNQKYTYTEAFEFVMYIADRLLLTEEELLVSVGRSYKKWAAEIANGLAYNQSGRRFTNAVAESNNNHIQTIIKIAYGYHNFERFRKRVLLIRTYKKDLK